ncbi:MAG: hypothetical protein IPN72_11465 [Saprospiraceae bacterium]|nr:hypothetical protein [Saprospiraceae bacterium]
MSPFLDAERWMAFIKQISFKPRDVMTDQAVQDYYDPVKGGNYLSNQV